MRSTQPAMWPYGKTPPIDPALFISNRDRLRQMLPGNGLAVVHSNDLLPANADATFPLRQNSDLFYLTGIHQEESVLLLYPDAHEGEFQEILFLREPNERLATWEGPKLTKEQARGLSGLKRIEWLSEFPAIFHRLMCECEHACLNSNEHPRAVIEVETRDARFVKECQARYPLHRYHRLARFMHKLRMVKSKLELDLIRKACDLTEKGFRRVLGFVKPGVSEMEIEAEFAHEFIRHGSGFAYPPIVACGKNALVLHYLQNCGPCSSGELLLLDVAANYSTYNSDLTRTIPVNGRFTRRQKDVYRAVLRALRQTIKQMAPGKLRRDWQKEAELLVQEELLNLNVLKPSDLRKNHDRPPALKKYFMHGVGHPLGLDVHDVCPADEPMQPGWVMTCEPGIYLKEENLGIRLENNILITAQGPVDLTARIPIEPDEIEELMNRGNGRPARRPVRTLTAKR